MDCGQNALEHLSVVTKDVYLPLLAAASARELRSAAGDELIEVFQRLVSTTLTVEASEKVCQVLFNIEGS